MHNLYKNKEFMLDYYHVDNGKEYGIKQKKKSYTT